MIVIICLYVCQVRAFNELPLQEQALQMAAIWLWSRNRRIEAERRVERLRREVERETAALAKEKEEIAACQRRIGALKAYLRLQHEAALE